MKKVAPFSREQENLIASFRGIKENPSRSKIRPTRQLGGVLDKILARFSFQDSVSPHQAIMSAWRELVGEKYCQKAAPLTITPENALVIQVSNPMLREQLRFEERRILKGIQDLEGCSQIQKVIWR